MEPRPTSDVRRFEVPAASGGMRLDRVLAGAIGELSRTRLKALVQAGCVRLDGDVILKPGVVVAPHQRVEVELREVRPVREGADPGASLCVLHEDAALVVIDKSPRMLVHPTSGVGSGTVSDLAAERYGALPTLQGADRPGIVHRLDAGTSGVMVLGRTEAAFTSLMRQFRTRTVEKRYVALVYGEPRFDTGWIETPIARSTRDPSRFETVEPPAGRKSSTYYEVLERYDGFGLVECRPKTGRTHQIRVHLASIEHPVFGDPLYRRRGGPAVVLPADAPKLVRQALHARAIAFDHPLTNERVSFEAPIAADLEYAIDWMRAHRPAR